MSLRSVYYSINHLVKNRNVNRPLALFQYFRWQFIKVLNLFPLRVKVSRSVVEIKNKKMSLEGGTKIYTQGMYDFNNMNLIKLLLDGGCSIVFDIGTNIGLYSLIASESKQAKVYSFEPHPYTFSVLLEQIALNGRENIVPVNKAVGSISGTVSFSDDAGSSVNSILTGQEGVKSIRVECCTIADFCKETGCSPEIVKIDVEGFELGVLQGFKEQLAGVKLFLIEISRNRDEIHQLLKSANFSGPFGFDLRSKTFSPYAEGISLEDPIYVNREFIPQLRNQYAIAMHEH